MYQLIERAARSLALLTFRGGIRLAAAIAERGHAGDVASDLDHLARHGRGRYTGGRVFHVADLPVVEVARRQRLILQQQARLAERHRRIREESAGYRAGSSGCSWPVTLPAPSDEWARGFVAGAQARGSLSLSGAPAWALTLAPQPAVVTLEDAPEGCE